MPTPVLDYAAPPAVDPPSVRGLAIAALIAANALWGASFLLGKIALRDVSPGHVILYRFGLAALLISPMLLSLRGGWRWADLPRFIVSGVLMVPVMMLLQFDGLSRTSATHAALIIGTIPVLMAVAAFVFDKEKVGPLTWAAAGVSTLGVAIMVAGAAGGGGGEHTVGGDVRVLISAAAAVTWTVVTRRLLRRYPSLGVTALSMAIGVVALLPVLALRGETTFSMPPRGAGLAIIGMAVGCTAITYGLWNWGLRHVSTSRAGVMVNLEPLVGAMLGITLLAEPVGWGVIVGGGAILASAVASALSSPEAATHAGADAGALPPSTDAADRAP